MNEIRGLDIPRLAPWLAALLPGAQPPFSYRLIAGGHSNLTYAVEDAAGQRWALRRSPIGSTQTGPASVMVREHRIQTALQGSQVPVPEMVALCEDLSIVGAPFYVMRFVDGVVIDNPARVLAALPDDAARRAAGESLIDVLVSLQSADIDAMGLDNLGVRGDYVARQLKRLRRVWDETKTRELPLIEALHERLAARMPVEQRTSLLHGDYRLGNVMLDKATHRVIAVLDWELATTGDARVDLAFLLCNWDQPDDPSPGVWMEEAPTRAGGFPSRDDLLSRYAAQCGEGMSEAEFNYFRALAYWRIAVIAEGIKRRYLSGAMGKDADVDAIERRVHARAEHAAHYLDLADRAGSAG